MKSAKWSTALAVLFIGLVLLIASWRILLSSGLVVTAAGEECDLGSGPCVLAVGEETLLIDIEPRPIRTGEELQVEVKVRSGWMPITDIDEGEIEFNMPGMDMGDHTFRLAPAGGGRRIRLSGREEVEFRFHVAS